MNQEQVFSNASGLLDSSDIRASTKPLEGLLVVSVEQALAAPLCTNRLAASVGRGRFRHGSRMVCVKLQAQAAKAFPLNVSAK